MDSRFLSCAALLGFLHSSPVHALSMEHVDLDSDLVALKVVNTPAGLLAEEVPERALVYSSPPVEHFDIPAGDAEQTLQQYLAQSKFTTLYLTDDVRGVTTRAVSGDLDVVEALRRMLEGTKLEVSVASDAHSVTIRPIQFESLTNKAPDQTPEPSLRPVESLHTALREVLVTGSLIRDSGIEAITSPLTQISQREIRRARYATVQDVLNGMPANMRSNRNETHDSAGNFGRGIAANLRGLGPGATLVLVNGRRVAAGGNDGDFVDLAGFPWAAVERIDVLPDGASALYGSDAVAGVINIIMRKDRAGGETTGRVGTTGAGAQEILASHLSGFHWASGQMSLAYQFSERGSLAARQREYSASADQRSRGGSDFRSARSAPGNILSPITLLPAFGIPAEYDGRLSVLDLLPSINLYDRNSTLDLLPHRRTHSGFLSASHDFGGVEAFLEARGSLRKISQQSFPMDQILVVPASNAFADNPFPNSPNILVGYSFVNDFGPLELSADSTGRSGAAGLRTRFGRTWSVELAGTHGTERVAYDVENIPSPVRLRAALADPNADTAFNPFSPGSTNRTTLESIRTQQRGSSRTVLNDGTLIADGTLVSGSRVAVKAAAGIAWREEHLRRTSPVAAASFPERSVTSVFSELAIPVSGSTRRYPRVELSLAARRDQYSDFGHSTNPKLGVKWIPMEAVKIRASWGTSFRAPKLVDLWAEDLRLASLVSVADPQSSTGRSLILAHNGNNPDLRHETASTWTAGIDLAPTRFPDLHLSLTWYHVGYRDQVVRPGPTLASDILLHEAQWQIVIDRSPQQAEIDAICEKPYFRGSVPQCKSAPLAAVVDFRMRNLSETTLRGLDLNIDYTARTIRGEVSTSARAGYVQSFLQRSSPSSAPADVLDTIENPLALRIRASAEWFQHRQSLPGFGARIGITHDGAYRDSNDGRKIGSFTAFDVGASYRTTGGNSVFDDVTIMLDASNVFDRSPATVNREIGFDTVNGTPYGRVLALQVEKRW